MGHNGTVLGPGATVSGQLSGINNSACLSDLCFAKHDDGTHEGSVPEVWLGSVKGEVTQQVSNCVNIYTKQTRAGSHC